jgi:hypothetical protein
MIGLRISVVMAGLRPGHPRLASVHKKGVDAQHI